MPGIGLPRLEQLQSEFALLSRVLETTPTIDKRFGISKDEFLARQCKVAAALSERGLPVGIVFSDQHYCGDVPYLGGNTNVSI